MKRVVVFSLHVDVVDTLVEHLLVEGLDVKDLGDEAFECRVRDLAGVASGFAAFLAFGADPVLGGDRVWVFGLRMLRTNEQLQDTHLIFAVNATVSMDQFARAPSSRRRVISVCTAVKVSRSMIAGIAFSTRYCGNWPVLRTARPGLPSGVDHRPNKRSPV